MNQIIEHLAESEMSANDQPLV